MNRTKRRSKFIPGDFTKPQIKVARQINFRSNNATMFHWNYLFLMVLFNDGWSDLHGETKFPKLFLKSLKRGHQFLDRWKFSTYPYILILLICIHKHNVFLLARVYMGVFFVIYQNGTLLMSPYAYWTFWISPVSRWKRNRSFWRYRHIHILYYT